jgi:large subunit ribosomal protein L27Ae
MRTFHYKRNPDFCPSINVDRLWSMVPEGVYEKAKTDSKMAPVIDVTKLVSPAIYSNPIAHSWDK